MRLIDADALNDSMYHEAFETDSELQKWDSGCWIRYKMFENHLDMAPTADAVPVVRGEWKRDIGDRHSSGEYRYCTACGGNAFHLYGMIRNYKYCPNCGAKMDEKEAVYD